MRTSKKDEIMKNIITIGEGEFIEGVKTPVAKESSGLVYELPRQEHPDKKADCYELLLLSS